MNRRKFLKTAGIAGVTLMAKETLGSLVQCTDGAHNKKAIALNGSPHENGNTHYALSIVGEALQKEGVDFEIIHIGNCEIHGCIACMRCKEEEGKGCIFTSPVEKEWLDKIQKADAVVLASPTYFGGIAGTMKAFLDRAFYSNSAIFRHKTGAAVVTTRRTGASMTFESLNQYFTICEMPVASSSYWNNVRGLTINDLSQDAEGIRTMQTLGKNIAKLIRTV